MGRVVLWAVGFGGFQVLVSGGLGSGCWLSCGVVCSRRRSVGVLGLWIAICCLFLFLAGLV